MNRFSAVAAVVAVAAVACAAIAQPAPGPAPGPSAPGPGQRMGAPPNPDEMIDRLAARIGLTDAEKAAAKKAARAKMEAAQALGQELRALAEIARSETATDAQLGNALKKFEAARAAYEQKVSAIDAQLAKAVSLKARVRLTVMGVIDNGLGRRLGQRGRPETSREGRSGRRGAN